MKFPPTVVGTMLRTAVKHHGYTYSEVCLQVGMSNAFMSTIVNGRDKLPVSYVHDIQALLPVLKTLDFENKVMEQYY